MTELTGYGAITQEYIDSLEQSEAKEALQKALNEQPIDLVNSQEVKN